MITQSRNLCLESCRLQCWNYEKSPLRTMQSTLFISYALSMLHMYITTCRTHVGRLMSIGLLAFGWKCCSCFSVSIGDFSELANESRDLLCVTPLPLILSQRKLASIFKWNGRTSHAISEIFVLQTKSVNRITRHVIRKSKCPFKVLSEGKKLNKIWASNIIIGRVVAQHF